MPQRSLTELPFMVMAHFRYEVIAENLRQNILAGHFPVGSRLPSEPELARRYGVNHQTLRKALALLAADGRTIYPFLPGDANGQEALETVRGLLDAGAPILAEPGAWDALLLRFPAAAAASPVRVGLQGEPCPLAPGYHAAVDYLRAGLLATRHLIQLGHRRIAFIGTHPQDDAPGEMLPAVKGTNPAYEGYRLALAAAEIGEHQSLGYYGAGVDHRVEIGEWTYPGLPPTPPRQALGPVDQ